MQRKETIITWSDNYTAYGFYRTKEEALNLYPSACCLFCTAVFGNSNLTPGHLQRHLKTQYPSHQNKSMAFFESCLQNHLMQQSLFENNMAKERNNDLFILFIYLVLASLQMAQIVMKRKRPYTELESVVIPCLEEKKLSQK